MGRSGKDVQVTLQLNSSAKIFPQIMSFQEWGLKSKKRFTSKTITCHLRVNPCCYLQIFMPPNWCTETRPQGDGTWEGYQIKQQQQPWTNWVSALPKQAGESPPLHRVQRAQSLDGEPPRTRLLPVSWLRTCQTPNAVIRDFTVSTVSSKDILRKQSRPTETLHRIRIKWLNLDWK